MQISKHGSVRAQQRSVGSDVVDFVLTHADLEGPAGMGRSCLGVSRRAGLKALEAGAPMDLVEAARLTSLVVSPDDTIVTVLRGPFSQRRRYKSGNWRRNRP